MKVKLFAILLAVITLFSFSNRSTKSVKNGPTDSLRYPEEVHLKNLRQLTYGADNAEAYWSFDSKFVTFQSNNKEWGSKCDQIFYMPITGQDVRKEKPRQISNGEGRTTCSFFMPGNKTILYASTHQGGKECP